MSNSSLRSLRGYRARTIGRAGEDIAASFLADHDFHILKRNFTCRFGEIDIIGLDGSVLAFVEVKNFRQGGLIHPLEAITRSKREKLTRTALFYLQQHQDAAGGFRFDLLALCHDREGQVVSTELFKKIF